MTGNPEDAIGGNKEDPIYWIKDPIMFSMLWLRTALLNKQIEQEEYFKWLTALHDKDIAFQN